MIVSLSLTRSLWSVVLKTVELTHLVLAGRDLTNVLQRVAMLLMYLTALIGLRLGERRTLAQ